MADRQCIGFGRIVFHDHAEILQHQEARTRRAGRRRPDTAALSDELAAVRAELADLPRLKNAGKLTLSEVVEMGDPLKERAARLESRIALAGQPSPLDEFRHGDPEAIWDSLDLDRKRAVLKVLMTVTVHRAPKGRPPGWKPGEPYFHAESVTIEWAGEQ